jgi:hypothetical protein
MRHIRRNRSEKLDPLARDLGHGDGMSGDVTARPRQSRDETLDNGIAGEGHGNGDRRGLALDGPDRGSRASTTAFRPST